MGGNGSGHWYRSNTRRTVESCQRLTPARLRPVLTRVLRDDLGSAATVLTWVATDGQESSIMATVERQADQQPVLRLRYTTTLRDDHTVDQNYLIPMVATLSNLPGNEGRRWWFVCPLSINGIACARRVHTLYLRGAWFACRTCHNLTYTSCNESGQFDRLAGLLAQQMGDVPGMSRDVAKLLAARFLQRGA